MTEPTRDEQATSASTMATGIEKRMSTFPILYIGGQTPTPSEAVTKLRFFAQLRDDVDHAKADYDAALARANAHEAEEAAYMAATRAFVRSAVGNDAAILIDFGLAPVKPRTPLTVDEQAAAIAKRESTRKARGTMGSRQKAAIHGNVTGVDIVPVDAPATPEAAASPQPAQAPATTTAPSNAQLPAKAAGSPEANAK